jgi:hypothetical protein
MSLMLCLMTIAFMIEILTLAPQYSTFGTQKFSKFSLQGEVPCKLSLITNESDCLMTNISKFYNRISISLPFFSTIFYIANWMLILVIVISLVYSGFIKEEDIMEDIQENDDDEKHILTAEKY